MAEKTTVVTAERFAQGLTYSDYLAQIKVNQDRFSMYDETAAEAVTDEDAGFFKSAVEKGCARVLVIGEDWCPDVYRGMPVIGRIAEVSGMDMRVFARDEHLDIADEFLNRGEFRSIPTLVFYNADQEYLCHWIERPESVTQEMADGADLIITMGCAIDEACPATFLTAEDWGLDDPAGQPIDAVRRIRDQVRAKVDELLERER